MGHMKKYKCPVCLTTDSVIRYGYRKTTLRLYCKSCFKHFSINPIFISRKTILNDHLDGISFRKLAIKYDLSKSSIQRICFEELKKLPSNNQFTFNYCSRFSNIFLFDGKYVNVKGFKMGMVLLWGIDYFRHDIPVFTVSSSENYQSWARLFSYFRIINHYPQLVVCDDNVNLKMAARSRFPGCRIQTCYNHFKENIRRYLHTRSDNTYKEFMRRIESILSTKLSQDVFNRWMFLLYRDYQHDPVCLSVLTNIERYKEELLAYRGISQAPLTTNLIESYNSHLESRLFSLKGFNSPVHAKLWLNGYVLKRRFTKLTSCGAKFRFLNGKCGIELTKKENLVLTTLF
jgi:hypothetical protein